MIRLVNPLHPTQGYPLDLSCPVVLCDARAEPIDAAHPGNLMWPGEDDRTQRHAHKGACTYAVDPQRVMYWREVADWVSQLAHNYAEPLVGAEVTLPDGSARVRVEKVRPVAYPPRYPRHIEGTPTR